MNFYDRSSTKKKWTIMMYTSSFDLMVAYAKALKEGPTLKNEAFKKIIQEMMQKGIYHPRNNGSVHTINFKTIQLAWYLFGYYDKFHKPKEKGRQFILSNLGELLIQHYDRHDGDVPKIFAAMLFGIPFRQIYSFMSQEINIYPFRLFFKLLLDNRLGGKIYSCEAFYFLSYMKTVNEEKYENLVADILELRSKTVSEKMDLFKREKANVIGVACHEWRFFFTLLENAGIGFYCDSNSKILGRFCYGNRDSKGRYNAVRSYREDYFVLNEKVRPFINTLSDAYSAFELPYATGSDGFSSISLRTVVDFYSFLPDELLTEIEEFEGDRSFNNLREAVRSITRHDRDGEKWKEFELDITHAFDTLFSDVEARHVGGSGHTDIEAVYTDANGNKKRIDIDCKASSRRLSSLNVARLQKHREEIGADYSLVLTPRFSSGVRGDIADTKTVIITTSTIQAYLSSALQKYGKEFSFKELDEIITRNLGTDFTDKLAEVVLERYGTCVPDTSSFKVDMGA